MNELYCKPNSNKYKEEKKEASEKKVEKVVQGTVKTKKKSEMRKFTDVFISEDASNVKNYILIDVLIPALKKTVSDIVTTGIDMLLYGESGRTKRNTPAGSVSYRDYYNRKRDDDRRNGVGRTSTGYNYDDIILDSRGEAEEVLERMNELIETYGEASVADLYDLVGVTGNYTDNSYGWVNLRNAEPVRVRDGYLLKFPKALPLKG